MTADHSRSRRPRHLRSPHRPHRPRHPRRWRAVLLLTLLLCGWFFWQQEGIQCTAYVVALESLPSEWDGLRIVQISDLHGKEFGADNARLLAAVAKCDPDLIAITGDLIDREEQLNMVPALARGLVSIAPTYYVTGNHEWAVRRVNELKTLLRENGVTVLTNEYVTLERGGQILVLAGLDDPNGPADQKTGVELRAEIAAAVGENACTLLLSHRDTVEDYAPWGYDVILCGHGHGGIFRLPIWNRGLLSSSRTLFPQYDGGVYEMGDGDWCVVSRGLGSNTTPIRAFRLFNRPELPLIILSAGEERDNSKGDPAL